MKRLFFLFIALMSVLFISCNESQPTSKADQEMQAKTELSMQEANKEVGMPGIINYQEKKLMKQIYELRDSENLICYAYLFNRNTGKVGQFLGKCIGYGLPYSTQFSNPQRLVDVTDFGISSYQANDAAVIPQPEPNGLFMPEGLSATWLLLIDPNTDEPRPVYVEPEIIVSPFKLH